MGKTRWKNLLLSMLLVLLVVGMLLYVKEKAGDTGRTEATLVEAPAGSDCEQMKMMVAPTIAGKETFG